jgi:hypothetical protein
MHTNTTNRELAAAADHARALCDTLREAHSAAITEERNLLAHVLLDELRNARDLATRLDNLRAAFELDFPKPNP